MVVDALVEVDVFHFGETIKEFALGELHVHFQKRRGDHLQYS